MHNVRTQGASPNPIPFILCFATMCDCGQQDLVTDVASGDVICQQCGVVLQSHIFDEHLEYYSSATGPRAGPPEPWLLPPRPVILSHKNRVVTNPDPHASVRELCDTVDFMAHRFSTQVRDTAKEMCRDLAAMRCVRADVRHVYAACALCLATKRHGGGVGRSNKEIAAEFGDMGVTERALTATAKVFTEALPTSWFKELQPGDLVNRFIDGLDLDIGQRRAVKRLAHMIVKSLPSAQLEGKTPRGVCSGVVSCALGQLSIELRKKHVANACYVSIATLDKMGKIIGGLLQP